MYCSHVCGSQSTINSWQPFLTKALSVIRLQVVTFNILFLVQDLAWRVCD